MKNHESVKKLVSATLSLAMLCSNTRTAGVTLNAYAEYAEGEPVLLQEEGQQTEGSSEAAEKMTVYAEPPQEQNAR